MLHTTELQLISASSAHNWVAQTTAIYFPSQGFSKNNSPVSSMPGSHTPAWLAVKSESEYKFWKQNSLHATEFFFYYNRKRWEITTIKLELGVHWDTEKLWKVTEFSPQYSNSKGWTKRIIYHCNEKLSRNENILPCVDRKYIAQPQTILETHYQ